MRKTFTTLLSFVIIFSTYAQRQRINFDEDWRFHFGNAGNFTKDFNYRIANIFKKSGEAVGTAIDPRFNDSSWRKLNLPHDWAVELPLCK